MTRARGRPHRRPSTAGDAVCISCGCSEFEPCDDGIDACSWIAVDRRAGIGVCSCCPQALKRWDDGDRAPTPSAAGRALRRLQ